jgi:hypothetical protein
MYCKTPLVTLLYQATVPVFNDDINAGLLSLIYHDKSEVALFSPLLLSVKVYPKI